MIKVHSAEAFRDALLGELDMNLVEEGLHYRCYQNACSDAFHLFYKDSCYEFGIADYTMPRDFRLAFDNPTYLIRFGIVYTGTTTFKLENKEVDSFSPSSFFVMEKQIAGKQVWRAGQHFHGFEVTLYADWFLQIVERITGAPIELSVLETNHTYHYLSSDMIKSLQQLQALALGGKLNAIYLESKMVEFVGILYNEIFVNRGETYLNQAEMVTVPVGNRMLHLNSSDLHSIREAHDILTKEYTSPPTIEGLSKMVLINAQKLKAGFQAQYHMTIGSYITTLRMNAAAVLLCTTNHHVHDIATEVGYGHPGNFIRMFRQYYGMTPNQYRSVKRG